MAEKSLFAGLTILDPGESILEDDGAFTDKDRRTIDRFLEIGAKTHRHNAAPGLTNPVSPMGASAVASAGQIPAEISFSVAYTLEDDQGGETLLAPLVTTATANAITPPTFAPSGQITYASGGLLTDTYYYAYSFLDGEGGETPIGPATAVEREPGYASGAAILTGLSVGLVDAGATGWNLYRAVGGGDFHLLASGGSDVYTDDGSASVNCDIMPLDEITNTTNNNNTLIVALPSADVIVASADTINVYLSQDGTFVGDVLLDSFPVSSAGNSVVYTSLDLLDQSPPAVNTSIGGASKIDPDTDMLDWHWKRPVASAGLLPTPAEEGDARVVLAEGAVYLYTSGAWEAIQGGGGGGGSGTVKDVRDGITTATNVASILFTAGSGIAVNVNDNGAEAEVVITASGGGGGGGIAGIDVEDATPVTVTDATKLTAIGQTNSGIYTEVSDLGGGNAQVLIGTQVDHLVHAASALASAVTASGTVTIEPDVYDLISRAVAGALVVGISTSVPARVRLYGNEADRTADASRPIGTDPTGDHGVQMDFRSTDDLMALRFIRPLQWWDDTGATENLWLAVTNLSGSTEDVTVGLKLVPNIGFGNL